MPAVGEVGDEFSLYISLCAFKTTYLLVHPPKKLGDSFSSTPCMPYLCLTSYFKLKPWTVCLISGHTCPSKPSSAPLAFIEFLKASTLFFLKSPTDMIQSKRSSSWMELLGSIFNQQSVQINKLMVPEQEDSLNRSQMKMNQGEGQSSNPPQQGYENRVRHVYLEEENTYGRFVPFLLLKDKLHSQIDSSGTSALSHMCSHNSPYLPLYLSTLKYGDPILNRATNLGHTPIDIAGMYCRRQYVDLLRQKGAVDDGKVDVWAVQGANIANWSGQVDPAKKPLIHWAAFNNFPQVLEKFHQAGANLNQADEKGNKPIDMAIVNKSYQSVEVLAKLGHRPKPEHLSRAESPYLNKLFKELDRSETSILTEQALKLSLVPVVLLLQLIISRFNPYLLLITLALYFYLSISIAGQDSKTRPTAFYSTILNRNIVYGYNHFAYLMLMLMFVICGIGSSISIEVASIWHGLYFWAVVGLTMTFLVNLTILVYGVATNTTPCEMFQSHKQPDLWKKIDYLPHKNIVMRVYKNPFRKDVRSNLQYYLSYRPQ